MDYRPNVAIMLMFYVTEVNNLKTLSDYLTIQKCVSTPHKDRLVCVCEREIKCGKRKN